MIPDPSKIIGSHTDSQSGSHTGSNTSSNGGKDINSSASSLVNTSNYSSASSTPQHTTMKIKIKDLSDDNDNDGDNDDDHDNQGNLPEYPTPILNDDGKPVEDDNHTVKNHKPHESQPKGDFTPSNNSISKILNPELQDTNAKSKKYFCPTCNQGFTRKHNMVSHELIHSQSKPHICPVCNATFRRIHDLKRHEKLHTGERPYVCDACQRKFARPDSLSRHQNSPNACPGLNKIKNELPSLLQHQSSPLKAQVPNPSQQVQPQQLHKELSLQPLKRQHLSSPSNQPQPFQNLSPPLNKLHQPYENAPSQMSLPSTTSTPQIPLNLNHIGPISGYSTDGYKSDKIDDRITHVKVAGEINDAKNFNNVNKLGKLHGSSHELPPIRSLHNNDISLNDSKTPTLSHSGFPTTISNIPTTSQNDSRVEDGASNRNSHEPKPIVQTFEQDKIRNENGTTNRHEQYTIPNQGEIVPHDPSHPSSTEHIPIYPQQNDHHYYQYQQPNYQSDVEYHTRNSQPPSNQPQFYYNQQALNAAHPPLTRVNSFHDHPEEYISLSKYHDLALYTQSLEASLEKINSRIQLLENENADNKIERERYKQFKGDLGKRKRQKGIKKANVDDSGN